MVVSGQFLVIVQLCYVNGVGEGLEMWVGKRNIYCVEYYCMFYFMLVGGNYIGCYWQFCCVVEFCYDFVIREFLFCVVWIFCVGQYIIQFFV